MFKLRCSRFWTLFLVLLFIQGILSDGFEFRQTIPGKNGVVCPGGELQYMCSALFELSWQIDGSIPFTFKQNMEVNSNQTINDFFLLLMEKITTDGVIKVVTTATNDMVTSNHDGQPVTCSSGASSVTRFIQVADQPADCSMSSVVPECHATTNAMGVTYFSVTLTTTTSLSCVEGYQIQFNGESENVFLSAPSASFTISEEGGQSVQNDIVVYTLDYENRTSLVPCTFSIPEPNAVQRFLDPECIMRPSQNVDITFHWVQAEIEGSCLMGSVPFHYVYIVDFDDIQFSNGETASTNYKIPNISQETIVGLSISPSLPFLGLTGPPLFTMVNLANISCSAVGSSSLTTATPLWANLIPFTSMTAAPPGLDYQTVGIAVGSALVVAVLVTVCFCTAAAVLWRVCCKRKKHKRLEAIKCSSHLAEGFSNPTFPTHSVAKTIASTSTPAALPAAQGMEHMPELEYSGAGADKKIKPGNKLHADEDGKQEPETESQGAEAVKDLRLSENQAPSSGKDNADPVDEVPKDGSQGPEPDEKVLGPADKVPESDIEQTKKEDDKQRIKDLETQLALIQGKYDAVEGERMMMEKELTEKKCIIKSLRQKEEENNERISRLEAQVVQQTEEMQNLQKDHGRRDKEIAKLLQEVQNLHAKNKDIAERKEKLKQEVQFLQRKSKDQTEEIEKLKKEVESIQSEKREDTAYFKKELETTEERVRTLEEKNDQMAHALARMLSSGSESNGGDRNDTLKGKVIDVPVRQADFSKSKHSKSESTVTDSGIDKDMKVDDSYGQDPVEEEAVYNSGKEGQPELEETSAATAASATHSQCVITSHHQHVTTDKYHDQGSEMVFGRLSSNQKNKASKEENVGAPENVSVPVQATTPEGTTVHPATALVVPTFKSSSSDRSKSYSSLQDIDHSVDYSSPAKKESHSGRNSATESEKLITSGVGKTSPSSTPMSETDC